MALNRAAIRSASSFFLVTFSTAAVSGMGLLTLALGWLVALTRKARSHDEDSTDG